MFKKVPTLALAAIMALVPASAFAQRGGGGHGGGHAGGGHSFSQGAVRGGGFSGHNDFRGGGREFRGGEHFRGRDFDRDRHFDRDRGFRFGYVAPTFGFGYYSSPYSYGYSDPCGYYDAWGYWHENPACYAPYAYPY